MRGLLRGHVVYASGGTVPRRHVVRNVGIEIAQHTLDLDLAARALLDSLSKLAGEIAETSST